MSDRPRICGATCIDAKRKHCGCFCAGLFHGRARDPEVQRRWIRLVTEVGLGKAIEITRNEESFHDLAPGWLLAEWQDKTGSYEGDGVE